MRRYKQPKIHGTCYRMQISFVSTDCMPYFITIDMLDKNNFVDDENLAKLLLKILEMYHPQFCLFMAPTADL